MSYNTDPVKRAAKRARQKEALARGGIPTDKKQKHSMSQFAHASSGKAIKKAREGERKMNNGNHNGM